VKSPHKDVSVSVGRMIAQTRHVSFILHDGVLWQIQHTSQNIPNPRCRRLIARVAVPDGDDILLVPQRHHSTADLRAHHELLAEHGEDQVLPATRREALLQAHDPLATVFVGLVLPHGADAVLEEMDVAVAGQLAGSHHVRVERPELFHGGERTDQFDTVLVLLVQLLLARVLTGEPQTVAVLQFVFALPECRLVRENEFVGVLFGGGVVGTAVPVALLTLVALRGAVVAVFSCQCFKLVRCHYYHRLGL